MARARDRLCQWGDCEEKTAVITINYRGQERPTFCCEEHAALWLTRHAFSVNDRKRLMLLEHMRQILEEPTQ